MNYFYNIFLSIIVFLKFFLVTLDVLIYYSKNYNNYLINNTLIDLVYLDTISTNMHAITEALVFFLLIIMFYPLRKTDNKNNAIIIDGHEKGIFFTLGIIGLMNIKF